MTTRELIHQLIQQVWDNCAKQVTVLELLDRVSTSENWQKKTWKPCWSSYKQDKRKKHKKLVL